VIGRPVKVFALEKFSLDNVLFWFQIAELQVRRGFSNPSNARARRNLLALCGFLPFQRTRLGAPEVIPFRLEVPGHRGPPPYRIKAFYKLNFEGELDEKA
jgi:hypothetical protein